MRTCACAAAITRRPRSRRSCCRRCGRPPRTGSARKSPKRCHRARVFRRRATPGDEGRRPYRRAQRAAHRQRADRSCARVRRRDAEPRASRSTISAAARSISRSSSLPTACSACARRPATRSSAAKTSTTRSSSTCSRCSRAKTAWICAAIAWRCSAQGRGRAREDRAVERRVRDQLASLRVDGQPHLMQMARPAREPRRAGELEPCRRAPTANDIDVVILVGGQTRMPRVHHVVAEMFGKKRAGASIPTRSSRSARPCRRRAHRRGPRGAAARRHAAVARRRDDGRRVHAADPRNTPLPARATEIFSTTIDNQPFVNVHVLQGEREMAEDNKSLAHFELTGIPPAPAACRRSRSRSTSMPTVCSACRARSRHRPRPERHRAADDGPLRS